VMASYISAGVLGTQQAPARSIDNLDLFWPFRYS
jgi:hypothetical protein